MKKRLIVTLIILAIIVLITFTIFILVNINKSKDITMTIKEGTLTRTSATVIIKDNNKEHGYGESYSIEKNENGEWKSVKQIGEYFINMITWSTGITGKLNFNIDWSKRYGELENGEYRIVKSVSTSEGKRELYAEFTIENKDKANENISDVTMTIEEGTLTRTSATIILEGKNDFFCGPSYSIEKKEKRGWKPVNEIDGYIWGMMQYGSGNNRKMDFNLDWSKLYGELENGEYRLVKSVSTNGKTIELYAEFTIE